MEYVEGLRGDEIFRRNSENANSWEKKLQNIVELLKTLYEARVTHDDFQHNNMIFVDDNPILLDLDHMRVHFCNSLWFRINFRKDVKNFFRVLGEINPDVAQTANDIIKGRK